jgi:hypothetical protein
MHGQSPTWLITPQIYERDKEALIKSYSKLMPHIRKIAGREMTGHRFLSPDHLIQESTFENGIRIIVNLSRKEYVLKEDPEIKIAPLDFILTEKK